MRVIASIPKGSNAEIRIVDGTYKRARSTIDIRVWFIPKDGGKRLEHKPGAIVDGMVPSKRGVQIDRGKLPALIEALQAALEPESTAQGSDPADESTLPRRLRRAVRTSRTR